MQEIAQRGDITEADLLLLIRQGLNDASQAMIILYTARTIADLKELIPDYERNSQAKSLATYQRVYQRKPATTQYQHTPGTQQVSAKPATETTMRTADDRPKHCWNCRLMNHTTRECRMPKRDPNACFRCFQLGHFAKDCPTRRTQSMAAAVEEDTDEHVNVNIHTQVCVRFHVNCNNVLPEFEYVHSLFDTGSPVNMIKHSRVPEQLRRSALMNTQYHGLKNSPIKMYSIISCNIEFEKTNKDIELIIVPDSTIRIDLLLGRPFLKAFQIELVMRKSKESIETMKIIDNISSMVEHRNAINTVSNASDNIEFQQNIVTKTVSPSNLVFEVSYKCRNENVDINEIVECRILSKITNYNEELLHKPPLIVCKSLTNLMPYVWSYEHVQNDKCSNTAKSYNVCFCE